MSKHDGGLTRADLERITEWYQFLPLSLIDAKDYHLLVRLERMLEDTLPAAMPELQR